MKPIRMVGTPDDPRRVVIWLVGSTTDLFLPEIEVSIFCNGKRLYEPRRVVMLDTNMTGQCGTYILSIAQVIYPVDHAFMSIVSGCRGDITNVFTYKGKDSLPQRIDIPLDW